MNFESQLAEQVFRSKYLLEGETEVEQAIERLVKSASKVYPEIEQETREYITKQWFLPGGGIWRAGGNSNQNVSHVNCTTLEPVKDNLESIFDSLYKWAKYAAFGQGEGIDISLLRPKGSKVHNSSRESTGAVSFMSLYDAVLKVISQQGRRGASLISIKDTHPDLLEFIHIKDKPEGDPSRIDTANLSIQVSDEFMLAVEENTEWLLHFENKYETIEQKISARFIFDEICSMAWKHGCPGLQFISTWKKFSNSDAFGYPLVSSNACQPAWAKVLTPEGIRNLGDMEIGSKIWSKEGWTTIINKWATGIKPVYKYQTTANIFYGTENHKLVSNGMKVEAKEAESIEVLTGAYTSDIIIDPKDVMDGLVVGDGSVHKASNNLVHLCIGEKDKDYFNSEVSTLIKKHRPGLHSYAYEIETSIKASELPKTYERKVPERFMIERNKAVGFLRGLFSANGSVAGNRITLKAASKQIIEDAQLMLSSIGIRSYFTTNKATTIKFSNGVYTNRQSYDLNISVDREKYAQIIGFIQEYKNEALHLMNKGRIQVDHDIINVELVSEELVYDITVNNESHTYWTQGCNVSNCGEIPNDAENICDLGHYNLAKFFEYGWDGFIKMIKWSVKYLNAVRINEYNENRSPTKKQREKLMLMPRIGLGHTGFADFLIDNKIIYGSDKSVEILSTLHKCMVKNAFTASYELANKYGSFPEYSKTIMMKSGYIQAMLKEGIITESLLEKQFNVQLFTLAPVGSGSLVANVAGSGVEPMFSKYSVRRERATTKEWKDWFTFNPYIERFLKKNNLAVTRENADALKEDYWVMSYDVDAKDKMKLVAEAQKWIDSSISITFNLPTEATIEDVKEIYMNAWKSGLKGVTVYREGSLSGVLITEKNYNEMMKEKEVVCTDCNNRPKELPCDIYEMKHKGIPFLVLVGLKDDKPYEIFVSTNEENAFNVEHHKTGIIEKVKSGQYNLKILNGEIKEAVKNIGSKFDSTYSSLSRLVSISLRYNVPITKILDQLSRDSAFLDFEKVITRVLKKYVKDNEDSGKVCPECGQPLIFTNGCLGCNCGFSKCD